MSPETREDERLLGRAAEIGRVIAKYGLRERGSADVPLRERARNLRQALEELGPTFAKLGQILSTRPDLLPPELIDELATLQDKVRRMTEEEVVSVMEEELGVPWEDVFESIEPEPLAAGTIGQVHVATLETGQNAWSSRCSAAGRATRSCATSACSSCSRARPRTARACASSSTSRR